MPSHESDLLGGDLVVVEASKMSPVTHVSFYSKDKKIDKTCLTGPYM